MKNQKTLRRAQNLSIEQTFSICLFHLFRHTRSLWWLIRSLTFLAKKNFVGSCDFEIYNDQILPEAENKPKQLTSKSTLAYFWIWSILFSKTRISYKFLLGSNLFTPEFVNRNQNSIRMMRCIYRMFVDVAFLYLQQSS